MKFKVNKDFPISLEKHVVTQAKENDIIEIEDQESIDGLLNEGFISHVSESPEVESHEVEPQEVEPQEVEPQEVEPQEVEPEEIEKEPEIIEIEDKMVKPTKKVRRKK